MKCPGIILSCLIGVVLVTTASADWVGLTGNIPLSSLQGGAFTVGDKEFSKFNLDVIILDGGAVISDPNIMTVQGVQDINDGILGDYGLRFANFAWVVTSDQLVSINLSFKVSILPDEEFEDYFIKDVWLYLTGAGAFGTGSVSAGENVWDQYPGGTNIASLGCYMNSDGSQLSAYEEFEPLKEIYIQTKYITLTGGTNGYAQFNEFFQFYSQVQVPEPASLLLFGAGLFGLVLKKRRI